MDFKTLIAFTVDTLTSIQLHGVKSALFLMSQSKEVFLFAFNQRLSFQYSEERGGLRNATYSFIITDDGACFNTPKSKK